MDAKVYSVGKICFHIEKSNPPQLVVSAEGRVNSSGWTNGRLVPGTAEKPADGILDFDFIAAAPSGRFVLQVISPISGMGSVAFQDWMKGIRVHSSTNQLEVLLTDASCSVGGRLPLQ